MLARNNIARLACARDNQPYIVPLRVDLDGEFLYGYPRSVARSNGCERTLGSAWSAKSSQLIANGPASLSLVTTRSFHILLTTRPRARWPRSSSAGIRCGGNRRRFPLAEKGARRSSSAFTSTASPAAGPPTRPARWTVRDTRPARTRKAGSPRCGAAFVSICPDSSGLSTMPTGGLRALIEVASALPPRTIPISLWIRMTASPAPPPSPVPIPSRAGRPADRQAPSCGSIDRHQADSPGAASAQVGEPAEATRWLTQSARGAQRFQPIA